MHYICARYTKTIYVSKVQVTNIEVIRLNVFSHARVMVIGVSSDLHSTLIGVPLFCLDGKRIGQIYHARLRMIVALLITTVTSFKKNIIDSPLCICGRPETTKQCFFDFSRFKNLRQLMMQSISQLCEPTLNALVYGITDLFDETNRQLFIIIQE